MYYDGLLSIFILYIHILCIVGQNDTAFILQVLCIVGQPITRIQGLSAVPKLKELWIAECQLQVITDLVL